MIAGYMEPTVKEGRRVWRCIDCMKETHLKTDMVRHVEAYHIQTAGFCCHLCGKILKTRESLRSHKTHVHKDLAKHIMSNMLL